MQKKESLIKRGKECLKKMFLEHSFLLFIIAFLLAFSIPAIIYYSQGQKNPISLSLTRLTTTDSKDSRIEKIQAICGIVLLGLVINLISSFHSIANSKEVLERIKKQKDLLELFIEKILKELVPVTNDNNNGGKFSLDSNVCKEYLETVLRESTTANSETKEIHILAPRINNFIYAATNSYETTLALTTSAAIIASNVSSKEASQQNDKDYFAIWINVVSILKEIHSQSNSEDTKISAVGIIKHALQLNEALQTLKNIDIKGPEKLRIPKDINRNS